MTIKLPVNRPLINTTNSDDLNKIVSPMSHYYKNFVTLYKKVGLNARNEPKYEIYEDLECRFDRTPTKIEDESGNFIICNGMIRITSIPELNTATDYFVDSNNVKHYVIKVEKKYDASEFCYNRYI